MASKADRSKAEGAIDELYGLPPDEFVSRRDELARALRGDGDREQADAVKGLRKPTVAAWAVNQLARREPKGVGSLLDAGEQLRKAHESLLSGGTAEALQRASDVEREAVRTLTRGAESILREDGQSATSTTLERVRETLHAAALDTDIAELVRRGRLVTEGKATGFGLPSAPAGGVKAPARPPSRTDERQRVRQQAAEEKRRAAEERVSEARAAVKEAEQAVKEHERSLEHAERELRSRRSELARAERELERAAG